MIVKPRMKGYKAVRIYGNLALKFEGKFFTIFLEAVKVIKKEEELKVKGTHTQIHTTIEMSRLLKFSH